MSSPTIFTEIKSLLNQLKKQEVLPAIEKALQLFPEPDDQRLLISLSAQWHVTQREAGQGLLTSEQKGVKQNQIINGLIITFQEKLEETGIELPENETTTPPSLDFGDKIPIALLYAPEDGQLLSILRKQLFMAMRDPALAFVDLQKDLPIEIDKQATHQRAIVDNAAAVLCLVTPNIFTPNLFTLAEQAVAHEKLIPIRVAEIPVEGTPFSFAIKGLPSNNRFVEQTQNSNSTWADIARALMKHFAELKANL